MKKIILSAAVILAMAACKKAEDKALPNPTTPSTEIKPEVTETAPPKPMDSVAMMKAWQDYATPGEIHKMFAAENGNWNVEMTMWMHPGDQKPMKTNMTATSRMILGGRYQEMTHKGNMMGAPFEGISLIGYDNASKKIVSTWIDNMGTGIMRMEGEYSPAEKTIELTGRVTDPMTGQLKDIRETYVIVDSNTRKMEMFDKAADGAEYKSVEIVMTRK